MVNVKDDGKTITFSTDTGEHVFNSKWFWGLESVDGIKPLGIRERNKWLSAIYGTPQRAPRQKKEVKSK